MRDRWNDEVRNAFRDLVVDPYGEKAYAPFDDIEPAFRFGWEEGLKDEYPSLTWNEAEEELRRIWHEQHSEHGNWDGVKDAVRIAWEKAVSDWKGLASKVKGR